jgi:DNA invertase Pin-like site-specific DNA recombinase
LPSWCFLKEKNAMRQAIGYIRVSSDEQADSGLGLEAQRQRIRAYCDMKGLSLDTIFEDAGVSGGKALASRPAGARLLAETRKNKPVLVVAKFDRLFRSVADAAQTIADFDKKGIELVAIAEGFDMTNPYGRAMAQMASVFAELERAMIRERTKAAMNVKRRRNERMSHQVPFGWDEGEDGVLVWNEKEQQAIARMRQWQRDGKSLRQIAALLNDHEIEPKRGKKWVHSSVLRILARTA